MATGENNKMKIKWIIAGISVLALAALAVGGVVWARTAYAQPQAQATPSYPYGRMGSSGYGMMGGNGYGPMYTYMVDGIAEALNLTPADLEKRMEAGETPWQIAQSQGLSDTQIQQTMQEAQDKALDAAVKGGSLTQEQADWMDQNMEQMWGSGQPGLNNNGEPGNPGIAAPRQGTGSMMGGSGMGR